MQISNDSHDTHASAHRAEPPPGGLPGAGRGGPEGTRSSNTVPSTCKEDVPPCRILRAGVDSLYLTFRGEMYAETGIRLKHMKQLAQDREAYRQALAQYEVKPHVFSVAGNGRHPFAYVLEDGWFRLEVSKPDAVRLPLAYCRIASELLTCTAVDWAVDELTRVVSGLGTLTDLASVSRVDLCVDFITSFPVEDISVREWVTRARKISQHTVGRQASGFSIAQSGAVSGRLYNKTLEMQSRPRPYLESIWQASGWDGQQAVWRLEFQFRRQALRDLGVVRYVEMREVLSGLWQYASQKWLRHTIPSASDSTQSRWPTSPFWQVLQQASWPDCSDRPLERLPSDPYRIPEDESLFVNGLSPLTSYMAREGILDAGEAAQAFIEAAREFHNRHDRIERRKIDFELYVSLKVAEKRRAYNTLRNKPPGGQTHPADQAVARAYKRRKEGLDDDNGA